MMRWREGEGGGKESAAAASSWGEVEVRGKKEILL